MLKEHEVATRAELAARGAGGEFVCPGPQFCVTARRRPAART